MNTSSLNMADSHSHATQEQIEAAYRDAKLAQVLYHDWEAENYDDKWNISFDDRCITYARGRFDAIVHSMQLPVQNALELGCGTGFFLLNLMQSGVASKGSVTDISSGMVKVALRNAQKLGLDVDGRVADAETIPYPDNSFDLVVGHAILHHIPDVEQAFREVLRVLKPGGKFVFAGEPSTIGDRYARWISNLTWKTTITVTRLPFLRPWRKSQAELDESSRAAQLEAVVDIHTFDPAQLAELATNAGALNVHTCGEELTAAFLGWPIRTIEAAIRPEKLGWPWARFAYNAWKYLSKFDEKIMRKIFPQRFFYNILITGTKTPLEDI